MQFVIHVSAVVEHEGRIVLVQERKAGSYGKWNLPGGHLELGEELAVGAAREVREEIGQDLPIAGFLGVYTGFGGHHFLNFIFTARTDNPDLHSPADQVLGSRWFTIPEIQAMPDDQILNPHKLRRILADYQSREPYGLECIGEQLYGNRAGQA